jgi:hypothetical protein
MMKAATIWLVKTVVLWAVLMAGMVAGGLLLFQGAPPIPADGPLDAGQAMLVVNAGVALILAWLAERMRLRGLSLGITIGVALFGIETVMSLIEAVVFNNDLKMSMDSVWKGALSNLLRDVLVGAAIAFMWRGQSVEAAPVLRGFAWKFPVIAVLYVVCYFVAGAFIAWQSAEVRAFYANIGDISLPYLLTVQFVRGLMWAGIVLLLVHALRGSLWEKALLSGLAVSVLMDLQLLYPNPVMPWPVRSVHMVEVGVSNFVFGVLAVAILLSGAKARSA